jgi:methyltransferase-like protein/2-polyprenyl-3-methyl-5-hydroxy-6-metoxy-1,4-benzoquinol methylase
MSNLTNHLSETAYDLVPYASFAFPQTHPDRLATIATLLGMEPAPLARCRVLELGCASGGNLIPLAQSLPQAEFVGIDLAARQVEAGQAMLRSLALPNITLRQMNILEVTPALGQFDYIIAHGIYSWVPPAVQDKLLAICRENLRPNGVAYVSYNTYPGWRLHGAIREMMLYHTQHLSNPQEKTQAARALLDFLSEAILADSTPHANFLHSYVNYVNERFLPKEDDVYLYHNELAEINEPLYFYQFAERAAGHGLKYLAEAQFKAILAANLPPQVAATLRQLAKDTIALEQYMDFLRNRTFRQTLLCHQAVQLKSRLAPERLARFAVASSALPEQSTIDIQAPTVERFKAPNGDHLATDHPLTKAAMLHLSEIWPQAIAFEALVEVAQARLPGRARAGEAQLNQDRQLLGSNLLKAYGYNEDLVELHVHPPQFSLTISDRPVVSPVARLQAKSTPHVTNLRHEPVKVEGLAYHLLPYLDGSWPVSGLVEVVAGWLTEGIIELRAENGRPAEPAQLRQELPALIEAALQSLARAALLVA